MKLTHKVNIQLIINNLHSLSVNESATADRIGKAIADMKKASKKQTGKDLENILRNVIQDLVHLLRVLPREAKKIVSNDIERLSKIMKLMNFKLPIDKLTPKT